MTLQYFHVSKLWSHVVFINFEAMHLLLSLIDQLSRLRRPISFLSCSIDICVLSMFCERQMFIVWCVAYVSRFGSYWYCQALDSSVTGLVLHCIARCCSHVWLGLFKHSYGRTCVVWMQTTLFTNPFPQPLLLSRDRYSERFDAFPFKVYS